MELLPLLLTVLLVILVIFAVRYGMSASERAVETQEEYDEGVILMDKIADPEPEPVVVIKPVVKPVKSIVVDIDHDDDVYRPEPVDLRVHDVEYESYVPPVSPKFESSPSDAKASRVITESNEEGGDRSDK